LTRFPPSVNDISSLVDDISPHFLVPIELQVDEDCLLDINDEDVLLLEGSYFLQLNVEEVLVILLYEVLSLLLLLLVDDGFIFLSRFSIVKKSRL